jgi:hypothetical protein
MTAAQNPVCEHCGAPAVCFGYYALEPEGYACAACCGHDPLSSLHRYVSSWGGECEPIGEAAGSEITERVTGGI